MDKLLSVCMIVKNEEDVLERCLSSIQDIADEIIIVDTGSTDSTKEIAYKYTNHVNDFTWVNDFSAARNVSIKHATSKWILILDADEYINTEDIHQIRLFLKEEPVSNPVIYSISVISYVGESIAQASITEAPIPRLFPNHFGIRYHRPIHEQPVDANGHTIPSNPAPVTVYHTGYTADVVRKKDKHKRNEEIFTALKKKSGFTPYDHFTVGNEFAGKGDLKKALYSYERAFQKATVQNPWRYNCAYEIWNILMKLNRINDAWELNESFFKPLSNYPEYDCFRGILFEQLGLLPEAKAAFQRSFQIAENLSKSEGKFWLINPSFGSSIPLSRLAHISSVEQNMQDVIYYQTKLLQANPNNYQALIRILEILIQREPVDSIQQYLKSLFPEPKQRDAHMLVNILTSLGQKELASNYYVLLEEPSQLRLDVELKYTILNHDQAQFEKVLVRQEPPVNQPGVLRAVMIGALLWGSSEKTEEWLHAADQRHYELIALYKRLIDQDLPDEWTLMQSISLFDLISELFLLQQFELFDRLVQETEHSTLLNLLANFLYSKHQIELAINYYQVLLERDALSAVSCMNLAFLHLNDQLIEDGVAFFERAIELDPKAKNLFIMLIRHCNDEEKKETYTNQLFDQFPQCRKLPFIQQL